jgi:hypothetical protein
VRAEVRAGGLMRHINHTIRGKPHVASVMVKSSGAHYRRTLAPNSYNAMKLSPKVFIYKCFLKLGTH